MVLHISISMKIFFFHFLVELKTFDHEYCTCVQTSLEQLEKLDCNVNLIKKLLDGSMTSLECQKQKRVKSRKMRDNGNKVIRFFPIHVAAGKCYLLVDGFFTTY